MRSLVVCSSNFENYYSKCIFNGSLSLDGHIINYPLIESEDPHFDPELYPNHVLLKKTAFSCNYREIASMLNAYSKISMLKNEIKYYAIGSEFVATVIGVGKNVKNLKLMDRVIPNGEYPFTNSPDITPGLPTNHASREIEILPAEKLFKIPDLLEDNVASAFTIGAQTTYSMIDKLDIKTGKKVLITGISSNTSLFALNALKNMNVSVFGTSRDPRHRKKLLDIGLDDFFVLTESVDNILENPEINKFVAHNGGFDYIIDPFADVHLFKILEVMNMGAKYISCGVAEQFRIKNELVQINLIFARIIQNNLSILGNCLGTTENLSRAVEDYITGRLQVVIDSVFKGDIKGFIERSFLSKERLGKVVFRYD